MVSVNLEKRWISPKELWLSCWWRWSICYSCTGTYGSDSVNCNEYMWRCSVALLFSFPACAIVGDVFPPLDVSRPYVPFADAQTSCWRRTYRLGNWTWVRTTALMTQSGQVMPWMSLSQWDRKIQRYIPVLYIRDKTIFNFDCNWFIVLLKWRLIFWETRGISFIYTQCTIATRGRDLGAD